MQNHKDENSFIMAIYGKRHKSNDWVIAVPFILALTITLIGAPILCVLDVPVAVKVLAFACPLPIVITALLIRKIIIINDFVKIKDTSSYVNLIDAQSTEFRQGMEFRSTDMRGFEPSEQTEDRIFMFGYSEYMVKVVYNWFASIGVIPRGPEPFTMYKITYSPSGITYLGVKEADLAFSDANRKQYETETEHCTLMEDIVDGKIVNARVISRII